MTAESPVAGGRFPTSRYGRWYLSQLMPAREAVVRGEIRYPDGFEALGAALFSMLLVRLFPVRPADDVLSGLALVVRDLPLGNEIRAIDAEALIRREFGDDVEVTGILRRHRMFTYMLFGAYAVKQLRLSEGDVAAIAAEAEDRVVANGLVLE